MKTRLKLENSEAAVVFRKGGAVEVVTPTSRDHDSVQNGMMAHVMFWATLDEEMAAEIQARFQGVRGRDA